ncbi:MAG: myo-inosose-2 dehydratase [bacterium]
MGETLRPDVVRVGINPIAWTNDDFEELGDDIPVERCLAEAHEAGYAGIEMGRKLPLEATSLGALLGAHGLRLVSGWHSLHTFELSRPAERTRLLAHAELLGRLGVSVVIVAECSGRTYTERGVPLRFGRNARRPDRAEWKKLGAALEELGELAAVRGMRLAYHPHAGTVIQDAEDVDRLLERSPRTGLLFDTGHLALAGADPLAVLKRWGARVTHVHLKNLRADVVRRVRSEGLSFERAVKAGVFTVPGDETGSIDFAPLLAELARLDYAGWLVVEAEQDPAVAVPLTYARMGREYVKRVAGV